MLRIGKAPGPEVDSQAARISSELLGQAISDVSSAGTWRELANCLSIMQARTELSYADLERSAGPMLARGTVSDLLSGHGPMPRPVLESLLTAWETPSAYRLAALATWDRLTEDARRDRPGMPRFADLTAHELRVHAAIRSGGAESGLPRYVRRKFDDELESAIRDGAGQGCFVLLVGQSSTGKTRSLYEAVGKVVPQWWLAQPESTAEVVRLMDGPAEQTVVWLNDLDRFLGSTPPLTKATMSTLVKAGMIVVGTLWYAEYNRLTSLRRSTDRDLVEYARLISVEPRFTDEEEQAAHREARRDRRIRIALSTRDVGLTQVLAAGPDLLLHWEQAPPYAHAAITAAADAHRLGVHAPLSTELLLSAMSGYLTPTQQAADLATWKHEIDTYATKLVHDTVAALKPMVGHRPGQQAGFAAADYLAQSLRQRNRTQCPPESLWIALIDRLDSADDLRRVSEAAAARMRYQLQERALRRLCELDDGAAHVDLAAFLARQDRLPEAIAALVERAHRRPDDEQATAALAETFALQARAEPLRGARRAELLHDGGEAAGLRDRAAAGDQLAADDLAALLAERGALDELRDRADAGHRLAADLLAELLATHRRLAELTARAQGGDEAARLRLRKVAAEEQESAAEVDALRAEVQDGRPDAADRLTMLLFERRSERELRTEVDAGTPTAAERLLALLHADRGPDEDLIRLRAHGLRADREPA
jgi:hypothetical protein